MWESTNLVDWTGERLVVVEDETAGMVWAPEAIWDPSQGMQTRPDATLALDVVRGLTRED